MKKFSTILFLLFSCFISYSQVAVDPVNESPLEKYEYIELVNWSKALSQKQYLFLRTGKMNGKTQEIELDEFFGEDHGAETYIQAVNLLGRHGWEFISRYADTNGGLTQVFSLFKRKVKE